MVVAAIGVAWWVRSTPPPASAPVASAAPAPAPSPEPRTVTALPATSSEHPKPAAPAGRDASVASPRAHALPHEGPRRALDAQIAALAAGDLRAFVEGFTADVQPLVTADVFATCRGRILGAVVRPDWEVAEESTSNGHRAVRVSIFGKSMTGFVEMAPDQWKVDRVWCLPPI